MNDDELTMADLWATGITTGKQPLQHVREHLAAQGILSAMELRTATPNTRVRAAGVVTHRQRPATASGVTFINLEDETGMINVIVSQGFLIRSKRTITSSAALIIRVRLERSQGVTNLIADKIERLPIATRSASRDWH